MFKYPALIQKSSIGVIIFWLVIVFQLTELKFIWGIEVISRLVNIFFLFSFLILGFSSLFTQNNNRLVWITMLMPALLISLGMFLNITRNVIGNLELINYYGLLLPWLSLLATPILVKMKVIKVEQLWRHFYFFMLISIIVSLVEYFLVFADLYTIKPLITPNGVFLAGRFTLFHMLEDESPHGRFYASFPEPGTLAMYLLPAILYALIYKKYFPLIIFCIAFYYTYSLGGYISLILLILLYSFIKIGKKNLKLFSFFLGLIIISVGPTLYSSLKTQYEERDESATTREQSISSTINNFSKALNKYPIGFDLKKSTADYEKDSIYFGSNFALGSTFVLGGFIAFLGYGICLISTLILAVFYYMMNKKLTKNEIVVFISVIVLFPFILQRLTIWDSVMFGLLFAPFYIQLSDKNFWTSYIENSSIHKI